MCVIIDRPSLLLLASAACCCLLSSAVRVRVRPAAQQQCAWLPLSIRLGGRPFFLSVMLLIESVSGLGRLGQANAARALHASIDRIMLQLVVAWAETAGA